MGLFSSSKAVQATTNQQVGVQGTGAVGQSGSVGGSQVAGSGVGFRDVAVLGGGSVNIVSSDIAALEANQAIATRAIDASARTTISALETLSRGQDNAAQLVTAVQADAGRVALSAVPARPADSIVPLVVGAVLLGAVVLIFTLKKS